MVEVNISSNVKSVRRRLSRTQRKQIPYATMTALNDLAFAVLKGESAATEQHFDRPTAFTKKAFKVTKATKTNLRAIVSTKRIQNEYLKYQVEGGSRAPKGRAIPTPTQSGKVNKFGNMPRGYIKRIAADRRKFFSGIPKGKAGQENAGIWERYGRKTKRGGQRIRKVVNYVDSASYKTLFPFYEIGRRIVFGRKDKAFNAALARALRTASR